MRVRPQVDALYNKLYSDPRTKHFFAGIDKDKVMSHMVRSRS